MLGYRGRTNRRDFMAGAALLYVGFTAVSMAARPLIPLLFAVLDRTVAILVALGLSLIACGLVVLWFWGWTVLATRRARDAGLPAWTGVLSLVALVAIGRWTVSLPAPADMIVGWGVMVVWIGILGLWPKDRGLPLPAALEAG